MEEKNQTDKNQNNLPSTKITEPNLKQFSPLSFFKKDRNFVFAHQKIEKLVAVLYMLTNNFRDEEPSKWNLRKLGMKLLNSNITLKDSEGKIAEVNCNMIREIILEVVSLLEIASFAGLVSPMNLEVLKREFHDLLSYLNKILREKEKNGFRINEDFFQYDDIPNENPEERMQHKVSKNNASDKYLNDPSPIKDKTNVLYEERSDSALDGEGKSHTLKDFSTVAVKKNKRQSIIIALLKRKKEIMIKDVTEVIHDCSEKTIQRELLSLVDQGLLKKEGERRWTRYVLA